MKSREEIKEKLASLQESQKVCDDTGAQEMSNKLRACVRILQWALDDDS